MVGMKVGKQDEDFQPPKNCIEEQVLDEVSFNAHMKHYQEETKRLHDEFRRDLIEQYDMSDHPKANLLFDKAWDFGNSYELSDVEDYFANLIDLVQDDDTLHVEYDSDLFNVMYSC